jgi:hypothetical protein
MNVLSIDRGNEALVDALIDRVGESVGLVLDIFDQANVVADVSRVIEQRGQHPGRLRQMRGELIEQIKELLVTRN